MRTVWAVAIVAVALFGGHLSGRWTGKQPDATVVRMPADRVGILFAETEQRKLDVFLYHYPRMAFTNKWQVTLSGPSVDGASVRSEFSAADLGDALENALVPHRRCRVQCEASKNGN